MATLGSAFPRDFRGKHSGVVPGAVIYTRIFFNDDPRGRRKYVLIAHLQVDIAHGLLFNSEVNEFLDRHPSLRRCQLQVDNRVETYLPNDMCFLACHKVHRLGYWGLVEHVTNNPACLKGTIAKETAGRVIGAITVSPLISTEMKTNIQMSLQPLA